MNRRKLLSALVLSPLTVPVAVWHQQKPPVDRDVMMDIMEEHFRYFSELAKFYAQRESPRFARCSERWKKGARQ